jgi:hypothetical protein
LHSQKHMNHNVIMHVGGTTYLEGHRTAVANRGRTLRSTEY